MNTPDYKCGYVAIIGRPNVGKSTLLNALIGEKISITTPKPQTTRTQILGIKTHDHAQILYIDTPGIHDAEKRAMNRYMNRLAQAVITDADVVLFMIEATRMHPEDQSVLEKLRDIHVPVILVLNKVDLLKDKAMLLPRIAEWKDQFAFSHIVPLSAKNKEQVEKLESMIINMLPDSPPLFPKEQVTDKNDVYQVAELIREKVILHTHQELPYSTMVAIESLKQEKKLIRIQAVIWVEREGQKQIVIGKNGEMLKKIGTLARKEIEKYMGKKVFLSIWVKVKSNWTDNETFLEKN